MMGLWTRWFTKIKGSPSLGKHPKGESNIWESKFQEERNLFPYTEIPIRLLVISSAEISQHRKGLQSEIIQNAERKIKSAKQDYYTWQTCPSEIKEKTLSRWTKAGEIISTNLTYKKMRRGFFQLKHRNTRYQCENTGIQKGKVKVRNWSNSQRSNTIVGTCKSLLRLGWSKKQIVN